MVTLTVLVMVTFDPKLNSSKKKGKTRWCSTDNTCSGIDKNSLNCELYSLFRWYEINYLVTFWKFMSISEVHWRSNDVLVVCKLHKATPFKLIIARAANVLQDCRYQSGFHQLASHSAVWNQCLVNKTIFARIVCLDTFVKTKLFETETYHLTYHVILSKSVSASSYDEIDR